MNLRLCVIELVPFEGQDENSLVRVNSISRMEERENVCKSNLQLPKKRKRKYFNKNLERFF
jgi:hypothetical protein